MKKIISIMFTALALVAGGVYAGDRTVTVEEAGKAVADRLEQLESPKDSYQVWVAVIPMSEYLRDTSHFRVFSDVEIKFSIGDLFKDKLLATGEIIKVMQFKLLCGTCNLDVSLYLDSMTNNAVAFYFENRSLQTLRRVELEKYDSLLEQLAKEYYEEGHDPNGDQYHTALYCVVDGRKIDRNMEWFYAGNGTLEAHAIRIIGSRSEETVDNEDVWWPLHGKWFEEVPDWLKIPEIDYVENGTSRFWNYIKNR